MASQGSVTPQSEIDRVCQRNVTAVDPSLNVAAAARLMREQHVGYLIVTEAVPEHGRNRVVGVLTDRDIVVAVVARDADPRALKVGDVMTRNPLLVSEGVGLDAVLSFMRDAGVRRVPVVGPAGELKGVLSMDDVLERMAQQLTNIAGAFRSERRSEVVMRP